MVRKMLMVLGAAEVGQAEAKAALEL